MAIYIWFLVQQMYVSLTYAFNIVQQTLSHIVKHRKLDSLAVLTTLYDQLWCHVEPTMFVNFTSA